MSRNNYMPLAPLTTQRTLSPPYLHLPQPDTDAMDYSGPMPTQTTAPFSIELLGIADLVRNDHVRNLFSQVNDAIRQATDAQRRASQEQMTNSQLLARINDLQNENITLKEQLMQPRTTASPAVMNPVSPPASVDSSAIDGMTRSAVRPDLYPESILWTLDDCVNAKLITKGNPSRPQMRHCIRTEKGEKITRSMWKGICSTANILIHRELLSIPIPADPAAHHEKKGKKYFMKRFPVKFNDVVKELERSEKLLTLCAPHWKAEHVVGQGLASIHKQRKKGTIVGNPRKRARKSRQKKAATSSMGSEDTDSSSDESESDEDKDNQEKEEGPVAKKQCIEVEGSTGSASTTSSKLRTPLSEQLSKLGSNVPLGPLSKPQAATSSTTIQYGTMPSAPDLTSSTSSATKNPQSKLIDIGFIRVIPSVSILKTEFNDLFRSVTCAQDLLTVMEKNADHFNGEPSAELLAFISMLDTANPNDPTLSEDDTNENWGHRQLSGTWNLVLTSWQSVGTCATACRLLAAVIKTCKVARHLCFERQIKASGYLSDMYLDQVVDALWKYWKEAGGPLVKGKEVERSNFTEKCLPGNTSSMKVTEAENMAAADSQNTTTSLEASSTMPSQLEVDKLISTCVIDDLKAWLTKHDIPFPSGKTKQRTLINLVLSYLLMTNFFMIKDFKDTVLNSGKALSESGYSELQSLTKSRQAAKTKASKKKKNDS